MQEIQFEDIEWLAVSMLAVPALITIMVVGIFVAGERDFRSDNPTSLETTVESLFVVWLVFHVISGVGIFKKRRAALLFAYPILAVNILGFPIFTVQAIWGFAVLTKARRGGYFEDRSIDQEKTNPPINPI
jgi:hypothetical protein